MFSLFFICFCYKNQHSTRKNIVWNFHWKKEKYRKCPVTSSITYNDVGNGINFVCFETIRLFENRKSLHRIKRGNLTQISFQQKKKLDEVVCLQLGYISILLHLYLQLKYTIKKKQIVKENGNMSRRKNYLPLFASYSHSYITFTVLLCLFHWWGYYKIHELFMNVPFTSLYLMMRM